MLNCGRSAAAPGCVPDSQPASSSAKKFRMAERRHEFRMSLCSRALSVSASGSCSLQPLREHAMTDDPRPSLAGLLAETTAIQAVGTTAVLVVPTIAPKIAETLGVPAGRVGFQISLLYLAAMLGSLVAGSLVARPGPGRTAQNPSLSPPIRKGQRLTPSHLEIPMAAF